jgi:phytoene desaturase
LPKKVNIIGSGIAGLASAVRLAASGYKVSVFEKNTYPGGKLSELKLGAYRFDKGPSLFTLPELIDELSLLAGHSKETFKYRRLELITRYFYEDGTRLNAYSDQSAFAKELEEKFNEPSRSLHQHLKKSAFYYQTVKPLFLEQSLHRWQTLFSKSGLRGVLRAPALGLLSSMNKKNERHFKNPKTVQLFNRYATYNGSNPYCAPALLNLIPHLEMNLGAYLPEKGMHQITEHLMNLANSLGVEFYFNSPVEKIILENNCVQGLLSNGKFYKANVLLSDVDIYALYKHLLPQSYSNEKHLRQEKSSSAYVFYWGVKKEFQELGLHNIFFSSDYRQEFKEIFTGEKPPSDPTVYINISSKYCAEDAPAGCENWFVMVNVPHNKSREKIQYGKELRKLVIAKINRMLHVDLEPLIETEATLDPFDIEQQTSSFGGSLYGNASNSRFSAFLRHANFSSKIKGLYLAGGSVHPGGGIPLCLMSAKIAVELIREREK